MYNKILIKNKMNEILRGDTDMLARKYIGRSADTMNSKDKDKALADIYMAFNDELKKSKEVKSDVALRREQIDNEMKNIRNRDRDELLSQRIRNYDPSISIKEKDAILGKIYDGLQNERKKLDKSSGKTTTLKPEIEFLPDRIGKPEIKTLPGTVEEPEITTLPYRPGQDNGYTNYPYYFKEEKTKGKTLLEDALRGTGVKNTNEPSVKMLSNRSDIQPVKYSMTTNNENKNTASENGFFNNMFGKLGDTLNDIVYDIADSAPKKIKETLVQYGRENDPPYDTSILLSEDDLGYNKQDIKFVGGYYDEKGNWHYWDNWMRTGDYKYATDPMQLYLNGEITEDDPEFKKAVSWWAKNGDYTINDLGQFETDDYGRKIGEDPDAQNYNRYDDYILAFTNYVNSYFGTSIDPNQIKAYMHTESRIGYDSDNNGSRDVMQTANDHDFAIHRLAAYNGYRPYDPNEGIKYIPSDGYGLFKRVGGNGYYYADVVTPAMSTLGGVLWYAVRNGDHNGGKDRLYNVKVSKALERMK